MSTQQSDNEHNKKMIAPIIITTLVIIYYIIYGTILIHMVPGIAGVLLGIIPLILAGVMLYVCLQRINEIRSGEEDDLSKY
ncbi:MAG: hypothetical protein IJ661_13080 [Lachnospiraceae bacterium]|nr:hypothetical protein [Lachnospiraceae bacterium]